MKFSHQTNLSASLKITIVTALISLSQFAAAQLYPVSIEQRVTNAQIIFEGRVISQTSFWNEKHTNIFTSNVVEVFKVFKGVLMGAKVEIITEGGTVGMQKESISHTLELTVGDVGIFTAIAGTVKPSQNPSLLSLKVYADQQGFIQYNLANASANDPFNKYANIKTNLYPLITSITKEEIKVIKKADYKIQ